MKKHLTILTGASRGMGLAMAEQLLGADALLLCISRHSNSALAQQAQAKGASLLQWQADLSDPAATVQRLADWLSVQEAELLASATLINNAGTIAALKPLRDSDTAELARALRLDLEAPLLLSATFLGSTRHWEAVPRKVLNISSGLGRRAMASSAVYCAAKAGMDHFSRCLALEEARLPQGARVCSLAPGVIDTGMQDELRSADAAQFPDRGGFISLKEKGQLTSPADAARQVLAYLARPDFGAEPVADVRG